MPPGSPKPDVQVKHMTEEKARRYLSRMLNSFTPGTVLHLLAEVLRDAEEARLGGLDELAEKRLRNAEAALFVVGLGVDAACPR
jgi:hypothetical protein